MDADLKKRTLEVLQELEGLTDELNPETFSRDNSLREIAEGLRAIDESIGALTEAVQVAGMRASS